MMFAILIVFTVTDKYNLQYVLLSHTPFREQELKRVAFFSAVFDKAVACVTGGRFGTPSI